MTDWLPALGLGLDSPFHVARRARALGLGLGALIGGVPGLHHRLRRRPVLHRHARRPPVPARLGRGCCRAAPPSRACRPTFRKIGGGVPGLDRREVDVGRSRAIGCVAIIAPARLQPSAAAALRLPGAADVGRGPARRRSAAPSSSASPRSPTRTTCRRASRPQYAAGARHHRAAGRPEDPARLPVADHPRHGRDAGDDLPRHPPAVRPLCLRLRRQSRCRRAGRHQHALDDHEDLHPDGRPVRHRRGDRRRRGSTGRPWTSARATSSTSSPRPSSAARRSPGGIGTIPGAVLGAFVMQSLPTG